MGFVVKNGLGAVEYLDAEGSGTLGDPWLPRHKLVSGAGDDAPAAGEVYPAGGVYQAQVDELDSGDIGRVRVSRRRAQIIARDSLRVALSAAAPNPAGNDIFASHSGTALQAADFAIRDTAAHWFYLPLAGMVSLTAGFKVSSGNGFDQPLTIAVFGGLGSGVAGALLAQWTLPASLVGDFSLTSAGGVGTGGVSGGASAAANACYSIPALAGGWQDVMIKIFASTAPTTGEFSLIVLRSS